jgi:hypothetical protein
MPCQITADPEQIMKRMLILAPTQATRGNSSNHLMRPTADLPEFGFEKRKGSGTRFFCWLGPVFRRHFSALDSIKHPNPFAKYLFVFQVVSQRSEVETRLRARVVAADT